MAESAEVNGRSLSQEVERRLSDSFRIEDRMEDAFGSVDNFWTMRLVAMAIQNSQLLHGHGKDWRQDPQAFDAATGVIFRVLDALRPGPVPEKTKKMDVVDEFWQALVSEQLWEDITSANLDLSVNEGTNAEHVFAAMKRRLGSTSENAMQRARLDKPRLEEWRRRREQADSDDSKLNNIHKSGSEEER
ncbi:hypothetical protein [Methylobacterium flocculans]|uniref:hypothetical protein n=1 Tax=Methylobacterium flocculans TaxID=2984843 RepID=UPI0021F25CBD|nr:hypothetical protein [Methylobacterium sp. FF17]